MTTAITAGSALKQARTSEDRYQREIRRHRLRFDRLAGYLALFNALLWIALLVRGWVLPAGLGNWLTVERTLRLIAENTTPALIIGGLAGFAMLDGLIGIGLIVGGRFARFAARARAFVGFTLCVFYFLATRDFISALGFAAIQGFMLALLSRSAGLMLAYPTMVWLGVFFVVPLFSVLAFSLGTSTALGTIDLSEPGLQNYQRILEPVGRSGLVYVNVIARTVWVAFLTTVICLIIGYPFAFWMAQQPERVRSTLMLLVMIPFWTNILIRTYAWLIILRRDGLINNLLIDVLGVISKPLELTNTPGALLLGLVYGYLPYMVLPLFSSIERLDKHMVEAAHDLYADPFRTFVRVILPLTMPGIVAGSILVFIPTVGTYVVTNVLGGGKIFLIGNLLEQQFIGSSGDKAFGAAFGVVLTVLMLIATLVYFRLGRKDSYSYG